jgi:hypothetical protein
MLYIMAENDPADQSPGCMQVSPRRESDLRRYTCDEMRSDQTHGRLLQSVMDDFDDGLLSTVTELCRDAHICLTTFLVVIKFSVTIVSRVDVIMQAMMCAHVSLDHTRYRPIHIRSRCKSVAPSGPALPCFVNISSAEAH